MYVVRIALAGEEPNYKAFSSLHDARSRFQAANVRVPDDFEGVTLFEVPDTDNARKAIKAVKGGNALLLDQDAWAGLVKSAGEVLDEWFARHEPKKDL